VQDVNNLMQRLIGVWAGVEQSVIDNAADQKHRHLYACIRATGGHFEYSL